MVINCAGLNSFWERSHIPYRQLNIEAVRNIAEAAIQSGLDRMVHVSTVMAYGFPADSPFSEESPPGQHASEYALSKSEGDRAARELCKEAGLPLVTVYLAAVVGPGAVEAAGAPSSVTASRGDGRSQAATAARRISAAAAVTFDTGPSGASRISPRGSSAGD